MTHAGEPGDLKPEPVYSTSADPSLVIRSVDNAALVYSRYWLIMQSDPILSMMIDFTFSDPAWRPNEATSTLLRESTFLPGLIRATRIEQADFGVERELGFEILLPHLRPMRTGAQLLAADARRLQDEGDLKGAAERVGAIFRMARHLDGERSHLLIETLVGGSIFALACGEAERLAGDGVLTPETRDLLVAELDRFSGEDPVRFKDGFRREVAFTHEQAGRLVERAVSDPTAFAILRQMEEKGPAAYGKLLAMSHAERLADLGKLASFNEAAQRLLDQRDAAGASSLSELVEAGAFGELARVLTPSVEHMIQSMNRSTDVAARARQALAEAELARARVSDAGRP